MNFDGNRGVFRGKL